MFESRPNPDAEVLADLTGAARAENQHAYRKVDAAARLLQAWLDRAAAHADRDPNSFAHNALAEIATNLVVSTTTAEHYATLGLDLERLPAVRDAFAAGDIDYPRARRVALATAGYSDPVVDAVQHDALAAARRCTPSALDDELDALLIRTAPDEHAELQADTTAAKRRVRKHKTGTLARIQADLSPEEAAAFWQRLHEVAGTVCPGDPRDQRTLLADAYVALGHGETTLACRCLGGDCTADTHTPPTRRTPLIQITLGAATLLGLRSEPAHLDGHGPIDPALARRLAKDATWVGILTETTALTEPEPAQAPGSEPAEQPERKCPTPTLAQFKARGTRHRAGYVPPAACRPATLLDHAVDQAAILDALAKLTPGDDGRGGLTEPPAGALTYRPDAATAALVRARDRHCRFPGCMVPAARCQLDHIVPFDHTTTRSRADGRSSQIFSARALFIIRSRRLSSGPQAPCPAPPSAGPAATASPTTPSPAAASRRNGCCGNLIAHPLASISVQRASNT